jgi:hypothetical protein
LSRKRPHTFGVSVAFASVGARTLEGWNAQKRSDVKGQFHSRERIGRLPMVQGLHGQWQHPQSPIAELRSTRPLAGRIPSRWRRGPFVFITVISVVFPIAGITWLGVERSVTVVSGAPHAAETVGESDGDQIRDVLQAISDAYNRTDVKSAESNLCARVRSQWNESLEGAWMRFRLRHGPFRFTIKSIAVNGASAHVTGTQTYTNDGNAVMFTAEMGRGRQGWKMCSSSSSADR